jgi:glycosyltransferase involved in cell wall biosynthesis
LIAALVFAALGLALAVHLVSRRRRAPALPPPAREVPSTTIVLPVRDEEENLVDCFASLRAQGGEPAIRIVDDGSTDATPRLLAGLAAEPRLVVVAARPLPPGWSGKVNALATAFADVETDWVLFTDADTRHAPDLLARAHAAIAEHRLDALSLAGREEALGAGENLITPPVYALLDLLLGDWAPHARGEGRPPVANGQYFLIRASALRAIGGLDAIAGRLLDDVALAQALTASGFRVGFRRAGAALRVRMYRGGRASIAGWRRNLALIFAGGAAIPFGGVGPGRPRSVARDGARRRVGRRRRELRADPCLVGKRSALGAARATRPDRARGTPRARERSSRRSASAERVAIPAELAGRLFDLDGQALGRAARRFARQVLPGPAGEELHRDVGERQPERLVFGNAVDPLGEADDDAPLVDHDVEMRTRGGEENLVVERRADGASRALPAVGVGKEAGAVELAALDLERQAIVVAVERLGPPLAEDREVRDGELEVLLGESQGEHRDGASRGLRRRAGDNSRR